MLALRKATPEAMTLTLEEVPVPQPGPGQARIAVTAAGICGTDLHILAGDYASRPPVTLGHEIAGRVDAVGEGVDPAWLGALVAPETAVATCGRCDWCRTARPMLCRDRLSVGSGVDGGFASAVRRPGRKAPSAARLAGRPSRGPHGATCLRLQFAVRSGSGRGRGYGRGHGPRTRRPPRGAAGAGRRRADHGRRDRRRSSAPRRRRRAGVRDARYRRTRGPGEPR